MSRDPLLTFRRKWQRARDALQSIVEEALANRNECDAAGDREGAARWDAILAEEQVVMVDLPPKTDLPAFLDRLGGLESRVAELEKLNEGMELVDV